MLKSELKIYAKQLKDQNPSVDRMVVQVVDSDLCLVIQVLNESGDIIGHHDTGRDADDDVAEAEQLANKLVEALKSVCKDVKIMDFDLDPDNQWGAIRYG